MASQIDTIVKSLKGIVSGTAALATLLPGGLSHGKRVNPEAVKPFGSLIVEEQKRVFNSSGVSLATYLVTLRVYVSEKIGRAGEILGIFHDHFDRLRSLPSLDEDEAKLVLIFPGKSRINEDDDVVLGKDVILAETDWTIKLAEYQSAITM